MLATVEQSLMNGLTPQYLHSRWRAGDYAGLVRMLTPVRKRAPLFNAMWGEYRLALGEWNRMSYQAYESRFLSNAHGHAGLMLKAVNEMDAILPQWTGQDLEGKRLLITTDGGRGDILHLLRYEPLLKSLGAEVIWRVLPDLADITGHRSVLDGPIPEADYWFPMMSLYGIFETTPRSIPPQWIAPETWTERTGKVGYCLTGNPQHPHDRDRSIHSIPESSGKAPWSRDQWEEIPKSGTWRETVAWMLQCRAIVTVDTSVAHMAASCYIPTCCLIAKGHDWRWLNERAGGLVRQSRWYESMTIIEQAKPSDWSWCFQTVLSILS